jgi:histone acetyltransferase (RNA polymerase elongator complex component)
MLDTRLEFGLQTIHAAEGAAIERKNEIEKVDRALAEVRRRDIPHEVSLIFGLPEQTLGSFLDSVRWCLERRVPVIKAFPLMLLRGTPLEQTRHRWGLRERGTSMPIVVASNSFDEHDWAQMARIAEALAKTEGAHPACLDELLRSANSCVPDLGRWQSAPPQRAA